MKRILTFVFVLGLAFVFSSGIALAKKFKYEGGAEGKGSIAGTVSYGGAPKDIEIDLMKEKNKEFCTTHPDAKDGKRTDHKILSKGGKLQDTVVFIENIAKGKDWKPATRGLPEGLILPYSVSTSQLIRKLC